MHFQASSATSIELEIVNRPAASLCFTNTFLAFMKFQEMARRVVELEQEAAQSHDNSDADDETDSFMMPGRGSPDPLHRRRSSMYPGRAGRMSIGGGGFAGGEGPGERALRAKNEMLERQLAHMKEEAEETQLELAAAKKVMLGLDEIDAR